jgi:hypothetical protein
VADRHGATMRDALLKITAIFAYCGGPLFVADLLKPRLGVGPAFWITFPPVGLMVIGALLLDDDTRSRWAFAAVWAGRQCLYIVLGMHLYAIWCFAHGTRGPDQRLHYLGIAVGMVWTIVYRLLRVTPLRGSPSNPRRRLRNARSQVGESAVR